MSQGQTPSNAKGGLTNRYRNWSIMLVGDHGRVIPLRRFKPLAIILLAFFVLLIVLTTGLSLLTFRHIDRIQVLQERLNSLELKAANLQKERDVYLAKMIIEQEDQEGPDRSDVADETENAVEIEQTAEASAPQHIQSDAPIEQAESSTDVGSSVKWGAEIRDLTIDYNINKRVFSVKFRVYNTSTPQHKLSGRCVVIIKPQDDPPVQWLSIPNVQLSNGKPIGDAGYAFSIKNYRTIELKTQYSVLIDTSGVISVHVFSSEGMELFINEYPFTIDFPSVEPIAAPTPPSPTSKSTSQEAKPSEPIDFSDEERGSPEDTLAEPASDNPLRPARPVNADSSENPIPVTSTDYFFLPVTPTDMQHEVSPNDSVDSEVHNPIEGQGETH